MDLPQHSEYQFKCIIGTGAFATVYKAEHKLTKKMVAIKFIEKRILNSPEEVDVVRREAKIAMSMDHPLICHIFDYCETDDVIMIVQELLEGGSLLEHVNKSGGLTEAQARRIFCQLVVAMHYIHVQQHVTHRDLKAENVLLDGNFNMRLIDFGLSSIDANLMNTICGSPAYTAPEVFLGLGYHDSVDIWSMGIILYAMVNGSLPFNDSNMSKLAQKIAYKEPVYPSSMSPQLIDLLKRLLMKEPQNRISISKLMEHPWITPKILSKTVGLDPTFANLKILAPGPSLDPVLTTMIEQYGLDSRFLIRNIQKHHIDRAATAYRILRTEIITEEYQKVQLAVTQHRWSTPPSSVSEACLPKLEPPLSPTILNRTHFNARSHIDSHHQSILCEPSGSYDRFPTIQNASVVDSPLAMSGNIILRRRTRALTFARGELVKPRVSKM